MALPTHRELITIVRLAALVVAVFLAAAPAQAQVCGNGIPETGEDCDLGARCTTTGASCTLPVDVVCLANLGTCVPVSSDCCTACKFEPKTKVCRASAGPCDLAENCSGASATCPANAFEASATVCRAKAHTCDVAETCPGNGPQCPADGFAPDDTSCDDALFCNGGALCRAGECEVFPGNPCVGGPVCANVCDEDNDTCNLPRGTSCDDGQFCNGADACDGNGVCARTGDPCAGGAVCNATCNEGDDTCFDPVNTPCNDRIFCNGRDRCDGAGRCRHTGDPCADGEQCKRKCIEEADTCQDDNFTPCSDGLFCTEEDFCFNGECEPGSATCEEFHLCDDVFDECRPCVLLVPEIVDEDVEPVGTDDDEDDDDIGSCPIKRECRLRVKLEDPDGHALEVTAASAVPTSDLAIKCPGTCAPGEDAPPDWECDGGAPGNCAFAVGTLEPPFESVTEGEVAIVDIKCKRPGIGSICLEDGVVGVQAVDYDVCAPQCSPFECEDCVSGDCSGDGRVRINDAICTVICMTEPETADEQEFDCECAADCNCQRGTEISDAICVIKRILDDYPHDPCDLIDTKPLTASLTADGLPIVRLRVREPKVGANGDRARVVVALRGGSAPQVAGVRAWVETDDGGTIGRIRLTRRLRRAGFELSSSADGHGASVAITPPAQLPIVSMKRGKFMRIRLPDGPDTVTVTRTEFGSVDGLPMDVTPRR